MNQIYQHTEINFLAEQVELLGIDNFLFKYGGNGKIVANAVAVQAELARQAKDKLPEHQRLGALLTRRSFEQSSSEQLAIYKASLFSGNSLLILAGGLGIDDWAFSKSFKHIISLEPDNELNDIVLYNYDVLDVKNVKRITTDAESFLKENNKAFDLIFIDPDRRDGEKRQLLLKDHQPNVIQLLPQLLECGKKILIKCSPLYDFEMAIKELPGISEIIAVSRQGEMKEMLLLIDQTPPAKTVGIKCVDIQKNKTLSSQFSIESALKPILAPSISGYLFEAGNSLIKMRKHHAYAFELEMQAIDYSVPYYVCNSLKPDLIGRTFKVLFSMPYNANKCSAYLVSKNIQQANAKARGMKYNSTELQKKLKLKDGGEDFLFVIPFQGRGHFIHCQLTS